MRVTICKRQIDTRSYLYTDTGNSFMQPGTIHFVISTENCLAIGGHFYSPVTLDRTLMSMVFERYVGPSITNTTHTTCGSTFMRMLCYLDSAMGAVGNGGGIWMPEAREFAHIIVIVAYLDQLAPFEYEDRTGDVSLESEDEGLVLPESVKSKKKTESTLDLTPFVGLMDTGLATIYTESIPEVWQNTAEFTHDFTYVTDTLIPEVLEKAITRYPSIMKEIMSVENVLLNYGKAFDEQIDNNYKSQKPFTRSKLLLDLYKEYSEELGDYTPQHYANFKDEQYTFRALDDSEETDESDSDSSSSSSSSSSCSSTSSSDSSDDDGDDTGDDSGSGDGMPVDSDDVTMM